MASGDTKTEALLNILGNGGDASEYKGCCNSKTQNYLLDAIDRVQNVEDDVEELKNNPDVVDIVDTYADLEAYDTSSLTDKDIIRVLQDSNYNNNSTYYRWNATTNQFDFVGEISGGSSVNVVQTTGTSQTDVMSQDAVTQMVYPGTFSTNHNILLTNGTGSVQGNNNVIIGNSPAVTAYYNVAIGDQSYSNKYSCVLLGNSTNTTGGDYAVALGTYSSAWERGVVSVGDSSGTHSVLYNNTPYRKIVNVYDGSSDHDAVTVGQINSLIDAINTATGSNISHIGS